MRVEELDTPGLIIDLDALEQNLDRYQRHFDSHGIGFRPHIKTHKSVAIARMQMARGAIGLTCQKLGEAEVMVAGGLPHPVVSGGSTPSALQAHGIPELTEYRAGEYAVGGAGHLAQGRHTIEQCALRVLATVVSRPTEERAILDAGSKTLSASVMNDDRGPSMGFIVEYPAARIYGASEEHGHVDLSACERKPEIGERVQVLPVHPCPCVNEHDALVALRAGRVEEVWPIDARGRIR